MAQKIYSFPEEFLSLQEIKQNSITMKTFHQFNEDAASSTQSAVSGSGSFEGSSGATNFKYDTSFKKRPSTGLGKLATGAAKRVGGAIRDRIKKTDQGVIDRMKPATAPDKTGPGKQPDRKPQPYRSSKPQTQQRALPQGKERPALPAGKDSMVARRTAAAKQPPQHKQISARPASTAMAGSRQRPAIRPQPQRKALPTSNISKGNNDVQKVNVRVQEPQQKALPPAKQRQLKAANG